MPRLVGLVIVRWATSDLCGALSQAYRQHRRGLEFQRCRLSHFLPPSPDKVVGKAPKSLGLLCHIADEPRTAENHDRTIVDRVVECGARQHETVYQRHCHAHRAATFARRIIRLAADPWMKISSPDRTVRRRHGIWLVIDYKRDVAHEAFVENRVNCCAIVVSSVRHSDDSRPTPRCS